MKGTKGSSLSLLLILFITLCLASTPLKSNLKLKKQTNFDKQRTLTAANTLHTLGGQNSYQKYDFNDENSLARKYKLSHGYLQSEIDDTNPNYQYPFTVSPYFDYLDAFLLGLKLETYVDYSQECIDAVCYTLDDWYYLQNNITGTTKDIWEGPMLNVSSAIAGNFSESVVQCELFTLSTYDYMIEKYNAFDNNIGDFLLAFIFNLMGQALKFKSIFEQIQDDMDNQYYTDIATQYGRLVRIIFFDFDPTTTGSLSEQIASFLQEQPDAEIDINDSQNQVPTADDIQNTIDQNMEEHFQTIILIEQKIEELKNSLNHFESESAVPDFKMALGYAVSAYSTLASFSNVMIGSFTPADDVLNVFTGLIAGGVNVYPATSLVSYCQGNASYIYSTGKLMYDDLIQLDRTNIGEGLAEFQDLTGYIDGTIYNCFFSFTSPAVAAGYSETITWKTIIWNLLYNLGYMYTDGKDIYDIVTSTDSQYYDLAFSAGDFAMRFLYSRYVPRSYYSGASRYG